MTMSPSAMKCKRLMIFSFVISLLLFPGSCRSLSISEGKSKICPRLLRKIEPSSINETWDVIIEFRDNDNNERDKPNNVNVSTHALQIDNLKEQAHRSQNGIIKKLRELNHQRYETFWITNSLFIPSASSKVILSLGDEVSNNGNVNLIREKFVFPHISRRQNLKPHQRTRRSPVSRQAGKIPWNLDKIGLPAFYKEGITGSKVIIGHIDTGADITHPAYKNKWAGKKIGWLDNVKNTEFPWDSGRSYPHGTLTLGLIVGTDVGLAKDSRWISCLGCPNGYCEENLLTKCGEFMLCPQRVGTTCNYVPRVVYNGWGFEQNPKYPAVTTFFDRIINQWFANTPHSILAIFPAGDEGDNGCSTLRWPGDHEKVFSIGATDENDVVAYFSGKGPPQQRYPDWVTRRLFKPDFVAPGTDINTTTVDSKFTLEFGTSLAAAQFAGAVAVVCSRHYPFTYATLKTQLFQYAQRTGLTSTDSWRYCGDIQLEGNSNENYKTGSGRLEIKDPSSLINSPPTLPMPPPPDFTGLEEERKKLQKELEDEDSGGKSFELKTVAMG